MNPRQQVAVIGATSTGQVVLGLAKRLSDEQRLVDDLATWVKRNKSGNRSWEDRMADLLIERVEQARGK